MNSVTSISAVPFTRGEPVDTSRGVATSKGESPQQLSSQKAATRPIVQTDPSQTTSRADVKEFALKDYTPEEQEQISELKARDAEVRAHETAHKTVAGRYAGAISYDYQTGPDGVRYAIGGEVPIDTSPEETPEATISKMEIVIAAALAPMEPSPEDRAIVNQAQRHMTEAESELRVQRREERDLSSDPDSSGPDSPGPNAPGELRSSDPRSQEASRGYSEQLSAVSIDDGTSLKRSV